VPVPPAPGSAVPPAPPAFAPGAAPGAAPLAPTVSVTSGRSPTRSKRSKWLVGGALAAVVATGAAGAFAVSNLTGTAQGGAATPEELGLSLLTAIENEDVLGVVDVLSPGERDVFRDPLVDLVSELTRLGVLSDDADLSRLLGVDVNLENEAVVATSTNVPDITNIDLQADATITFDGADLPVGDLITENLPDDMLTVMRGTRLTETDELDVRLTAVEEDGRWYFSVFHSVAEAARSELAPSSLIPVQGIGADGAESPEAAFDNLLDQVEALDLTGMIRALNPGEAAALQRYSPLFIEEAESLLAEVPLEWEITRREFRVDESGDTAAVFVDALGIEGNVEGESFSLEFADGCVRASAAGESIEQCSEGAFDDATGVFDETPEIKRLIDTVNEAFSDVEEVGIEMRLTDGLWYVSPITTSTEAGLALLRALDRSEIDAIVDQAPAAGDEFMELIVGGINGLPGALQGMEDFDDLVDDDLLDDDLLDDVLVDDATSADGGAMDIIVDDGTADDAGWQNCYSEFDPVAAQECFAAAIESGEITRAEVPVALRYPECGYVESWGGAIYSLPDADFIAAAEAARPCFLDLVELGEVSEFELPSEITHIECFEGRNWYNVFDDPEFDERYYDCISGGADN
jgi:hypothetical protein